MKRTTAKYAGQPLGLTTAEAQCIRAYIEEGCQKMAARKLDVSVHTVNELMRRARERTGIKASIHLAVEFDRVDRQRSMS